jgi:hypothetical protein
LVGFGRSGFDCIIYSACNRIPHHYNFEEMKDPEIKTAVVHSESKDAWNVIGRTLGKKYKIARVPYLATENKKLTAIAKAEAKK